MRWLEQSFAGAVPGAGWKAPAPGRRAIWTVGCSSRVSVRPAPGRGRQVEVSASAGLNALHRGFPPRSACEAAVGGPVAGVPVDGWVVDRDVAVRREE